MIVSNIAGGRNVRDLRHPLDSLQQRLEEGLLTKTLPEHGVCDRREDVKHYSHTYKNLPACDVELINVFTEPSNEAVVDKTERNSLWSRVGQQCSPCFHCVFARLKRFRWVGTPRTDLISNPEVHPMRTTILLQ